jgi:hypothetical protein
MARLGAARGVRVELTLMDRSETAVRTAMEAARAAGIVSRGIVGDIMSSSSILDAAGVDVVTNSLFLHHLSSAEQVSGVLGRMDQMAGRLVVISDLRRSRAGWLAAWAGCRMLSRSRIVHRDGPASVRAAWTMGEIRGFARSAGIGSARIVRCYPMRMLITWQPL